MSEIQDVRLVIKIDNKQPIELLDLTKSLVALSTQFNAYVDKYADSKENREAKLYVKEIKSGSVILELVEFATLGMIPFLENTNTIIGFAEYCKSAINFFLKDEGNKPEFSGADYKEFSAIINPIAKDLGSQFNINTTINGNLTVHLKLDSTESNALQNIFKGEIEKLKLPEQPDDIINSVLLIWFQARNDMKSKTGNKVVIEEISRKPLNITFDNEEIKEKMLRGDLNPFNTAFIVDVKIQTIQDKPAAYKVMRLHEHFEINED